MKKFKLSFSLLVATLAVGIALATKAHTFGKKQVTACFRNVTVTNGSSTQSLNPLTCQQAQNATLPAARPFIFSASSADSPENCIGNHFVFCCATVVETSNPNAPLINLGDGFKRYAVQQVFCEAVRP